MHKNILIAVILLSLLGLVDSSYLTYEHYSQNIPPCTISQFADCGKVLKSEYSMVFGLIPLALLGVIHYTILLGTAIWFKVTHIELFKQGIKYLTILGAIASAYFVYLQLFVIGAICFYCMVSAINSLVLVILAHISIKHERF